MQEGRRYSGSLRRLLVATSAVCVLAAAAAPAALADLNLTGAADALPPVQAAEPATQVVEEVAAPVVDPVEQTAAPVTEPVQKTTEKPLETAKESVNQTAAPVVEQVNATAGPVVKEVTDTAAPVVKQVADTAAPVVQQVTETAAPVVEKKAAAAGGEASQSVVPAAGITPPGGAVAVAADSPTRSISSAGSVVPGSGQATRRAPKGHDALSHGVTPTMLPSSPGALDTAPVAGGPRAHALAAPLPDSPGWPWSDDLASAFASAGGGALTTLLAALAATLLLAAPGLGRRLRPRLAPWPQPILQLSFERPG